MSSPRLGEYLVQRGLIGKDQLASAMLQQRRTGERLGRLLLILDYISRLDLARALAELWGFPFITIDAGELNIAVAQRFPLEATLRYRALPLSDDGDTLTVAVAEPPETGLRDTLTMIYPNRHLAFRVTTEWDIDRGIALVHRHQVVDGSIYGLYFRSQQESALNALTRPQCLILLGLLIAVASGFWFQPMVSLLALNFSVTAFFLAVILFQSWVTWHGAAHPLGIGVAQSRLGEDHERDFPVYTVLVPVDQSGAQVSNVLRSLRQLDYPADKLDIILLFAENDPETLAAAKAVAPSENVRFLVVPSSEPQTYAKACNVGLLFARGEYLVCYSPEDQPAADQLKQSLLAFRRGPENLACVQAVLSYYNWNENILTRLLSLEYSFWFHCLRPGLDRLRLPIPLGGTSNHFRTNVLRALGGWDPFNVTEDADLGMRAAMRGYRVGILNSSTHREASQRLPSWIRERARWIKGWAQTALVVWRDPARRTQHSGWRKTIGFTLLVASAPLIFLIQPVSICLALLWAVMRHARFTPAILPTVLYLALFNIMAGCALAIYVNLFAGRRRRFAVVQAAPL